MPNVTPLIHPNAYGIAADACEVYAENCRSDACRVASALQGLSASSPVQNIVRGAVQMLLTEADKAEAAAQEYRAKCPA